MSANFDQLLAEAGLADKAVRIDNHLIRMQWGSAHVIAGISGSAIVAVAPLFKSLPAHREQTFYRRLLELNAHMGGMASFAIQPDGWIVLHAGRALKGLDGHEFATMIAAVGRFADQFDDQLIQEFYAGVRQPMPEDEVPKPVSAPDGPALETIPTVTVPD